MKKVFCEDLQTEININRCEQGMCDACDTCEETKPKPVRLTSAQQRKIIEQTVTKNVVTEAAEQVSAQILPIFEKIEKRIQDVSEINVEINEGVRVNLKSVTIRLENLARDIDLFRESQAAVMKELREMSK